VIETVGVEEAEFDGDTDGVADSERDDDAPLEGLAEATADPATDEPDEPPVDEPPVDEPPAEGEGRALLEAENEIVGELEGVLEGVGDG
jgi:hypothetical protein